MAERNLAAIPTQKVPRHAYDRPHDDKDKNVQASRCSYLSAAGAPGLRRSAKGRYFFTCRTSSAQEGKDAAGMKISAATKMTNLPYRGPSHADICRSQRLQKHQGQGRRLWPRQWSQVPPRIVITKAMSVHCRPGRGRDSISA